MRRRDLITLVAGAAVAGPGAALAQASDRVRRVGILVPLPKTDPVVRRNFTAFADEMAKAGWVEGKTVQYDFRSSLGAGVDIATSAAEIVALAPDVILAITPQSTYALKRIAGAIPAVFVVVDDPLRNGIVASIARPGGLFTGVAELGYAAGPKTLQLLKQMATAMTRVAFLYDSSENPPVDWVEGAARAVAVTPSLMTVGSDAEIDSALATFGREPDGGVVVIAEIFTASHRRRIIDAVARLGLPAVYPYRYFAADGGLMSYSPEQTGEFRQAAYLVDRILHGAAPADLPVQTPNRFEMIINAKTAQALGITVPALLLTGADEVIE